MAEYHYTTLNRAEQGYYRLLLNAYAGGAGQIPPVSGISASVMKKVIIAVNYDHPELFYVDFKYLRYTTSSRGVSYQPDYTVPRARRAFAVAQMERLIGAAVAEARRAGLKSDYEKCLWIHDYLIEHTTYCEKALKKPGKYPDAYGISGVFRDGSAVCEGISKAFLLLCERLGVKALIAVGKSALRGFFKSGTHAWNIVCTREGCSHIDVTWDLNFTKVSKCIRYDYFGLPDRWMKKDHTYRHLPKCDTDSFSCLLRQKVWFTAREPLERYLERALTAREPLLYFKLEYEGFEGEAAVEKLHRQMQEAAAHYCQGRCFVETVPNEKQMCFFLRIRKDVP